MLKLLRRKPADPRKELRKVLGEFDLPSFPGIVTTVLQKIRDEDAALSEIGDSLSTDPGLSVRLLSTVNSAAFAVRHHISSVPHAVSMLGRNQLESILISVAVRDVLPSTPAPGYDVPRFWATAARRATTGRALADVIHPATSSETFTASLLQDLAVPILCGYKGGPYTTVLEQWHDATDDLAVLEREAFGWDHAEIAGWICQEWKLPEQVVAAIGGHHDADGRETVILPAVNLVSALREVNEDAGVERLVDRAEASYGLPRETTAELVRGAFDTAAEIAQLFS